MTGEILKSGFGERKGSVSKWSLAFLAMCVAFAAVVFVFTENQEEQLKEDIVTMMGVPELPQLEGLSPALLNALGEVYDKLRLNPADRKALEELSLLYQANGFAEKAKQGYRSLAVLEPEDALWSLRLAMLHADASDPSLELKYLDETLAKGGGTDRLLLLKAKALVRNGRPEDAEQLITSVLKSDPANRDALIEKGLMALNSEEFELAAAVFEKALQSDADYFPLYLYLENAYGALADDRKYVAQYQQYLRTEIEHTIYYEEEQRVLGYCRDPIRLMSIAERKLKGGRWELAVKLLEAAGEADPGFSEGLGVLGRAYRMLGDDQAVIDLLSPLVSGETLDADALAELTRACLELGLIPGGVATAMKGLEIAPLSEEFYGLLGRLYLRSDARSEAEEAFRKAVELNSRDAESLAELGSLQLIAGRAVGVDLMNRSLALRPENVPARLKLAAHHLKLGEIEAAQEQLEDALLYDPENQQSKRGLAKAYARQGNRLAGMGEIERAVERFNQALLLDSGVPDVHENLGMLQEHLDQPKLAIAHFDRLISLRPEASGGYLRLGRLLVAEGENERARKVLLEGRSVALTQSLHGEVHEFDSLLDVVE